MYIIISIFETIRFKLTASGKTAHSFFHYKVMRPVSNLRLLKEQNKKQAKPAKSKKS